jgi:type I restriction enzyme, S subunit
MRVFEPSLTGDYVLDLCRSRRATGPRSQYQVSVAMAELPLPTLPNSWLWTSLSELCERVSVGHVGPTTIHFCTKDTGVSFIRSQDVRPGKLQLGQAAYITKEFHSKLKKSKLRPGDVLIVRVGANRGDTCVVPEGVGEINCANIVFARPMFPNGFLGLYFRSPFGQKMLLSLTTGSAQGVLNTQDIARLPVPCPPLPIQEKVASILSAYDDLIENNTLRIKILEKVVKSVYREWFIQFRFPGHEKASITASPLGNIPQEWKVAKLGELISIDKGVSYNGAGLTPDGNPMVNLKNILPGGGFRRDATKPYSGDFKARHTVRAGDVVLANTDLTQAGNVVASAALIPEIGEGRPILISHHLYAVRLLDAKISPHFIYNLLLTDEFRGFAKGYAIGTTVLGLVKDGVLEYEFPRPSQNLIEMFSQIAEPIYDLIENLHQRNETLRRTRDLLLPKLISGEVNVGTVPLVNDEI